MMENYRFKYYFIFNGKTVEIDTEQPIMIQKDIRVSLDIDDVDFQNKTIQDIEIKVTNKMYFNDEVRNHYYVVYLI